MTKWKPRNSAERKAAAKASAFIKHLTHTKGKWAGSAFTMLPWQEQEVILPIFGTLNPDGNRQYRTAYIEVPKKAGKSELAAAVALKLLFADGEAGGEVYSAAVDRDQASIVFNVAAQMVRNSSELSARAKIIDSSKRIIVTKGKSAGSFYRAIPADVAGSDGFNPSAIIFDEIHRQPNRDLYQVLTSSTGAREQPLTFGITTAGFDRFSLCWELHKYAAGLLKLRNAGRYQWLDLPTAVTEDPTFFASVYGVEETADWTDPSVWKRANPSLGTTVQLPFLEKEARVAMDNPTWQNDFRRLHLNQWTAQESRAIDMRIWDANAGEIDLGHLKGRTCYAGLDLASTTDIAALVLVFQPISPMAPYDVLPFFWIPADTMREKIRRDGVPYDIWAGQEAVIPTEGNVIHYAAIRDKIDELAHIYHIDELAFDRWGAVQMTQELQDAGMTVVEFGQGFKDMSPPTKELLKVIMERRLRHGGHPVLRWMCDNLMLATDPAGNLKPSRDKSTQKIDGMVALVMALDRATRQEPSVYESRPITVLG